VLRKHTWDVLREGFGYSLEGFGIAHWPVDTTKAYSRFRVLQTGKNSGWQQSHLCCAGIELFGQLH
jgi:hypothetical protein